MKKPSIALAMIVKGDDKEALLLDRCLTNLAPHVDGIFITRTTRKGLQKNEAVADVVKKHNGVLTDFEWVYDFAAARNFSFAQVPKEFSHILWTDADDIWRGAEKLKKTIRENQLTDAFGFMYLYDFDDFKKPTVVHQKTMLVKNDGCVTWVGAIHEDLQPTRQLDTRLVEGIERLHITDAARIAENAKRNLEIASYEAKDNPTDPRSYWNLANARLGVTDYQGAREAFDTFLATSESDDEKYLAHMRIADTYKSSGDMSRAIHHLQTAIGLAPSLPDAYFQLAYLYTSMSQFDKAEHYCLQGMMKRPQVHKMIVFNPRDYDYNPMMLLAQIYYHKNRPDLMLPLLEGCLKIYPNDEHLHKLVKEGRADKKLLAKALFAVQKLQAIKDKKKLRAAIDKLPDDIKSHPSIAVIRNINFVKEASSGKDLVIYCGQTSFDWNPELFKTKGFGGSEEAVINLSREFAKLGWNVTVYNTCGHKPMTVDGVTYRPFWEWNYRDKQDVTILWRWAKPLDAEINSTKIFVDLHDVVPAGEFNEGRLKKLTGIFVKSQFHRSLFPNVPDEKFIIVPNGIDTSLFEKVKKDPYLMINTSSPDRSLNVLPKLFKKVKERVPMAKMQWAYGWELFEKVHANDEKKLQWAKDTQKAMREAGIEVLGRVTQAEVAKLYSKATVFAYPTEFAEIDCISARKAQAAGCVPITTDFAALNETVTFGVKVHSKKNKDNWNAPYQFHFGLEDEIAQEEWVDAACIYLGKQLSKDYLDETEKWGKQFAWSEIAKKWNTVLCA